MNESKKGVCLSLIGDMKNAGDMLGAAVITRDGLLYVSDLPDDVDTETFAAMSATMFGAAETAALELRKSSVQRVIAEGGDVKLVSTSAGENVMLVSMVSNDSDLGLVLMETEKTAKLIRDMKK
ncbi:MAG: roadblock/LC7 domain-containing protein [Candidatus Altiarchaeota archaeon]|nr:roadblock/LC7 domain-containing protein [Candidatus Altiarchaeota archaeon]